MKDGSEMQIESPATFPNASDVTDFKEPIVRATITCPEESAHPLITLCRNHRGELLEHTPIAGGGGRVLLRFRLPFAEIVTRFYDRVKSISSGYASFGMLSALSSAHRGVALILF
jgi:translation elongation factor EF-4